MVTAYDVIDEDHPRRPVHPYPGRPWGGTGYAGLREPRSSRAGWVIAFVVVLVLTTFTVLGGTASDVPVRTSGTVDLGEVVQRVTPWSIGVGASTYGATLLTSPIEARNERRLGAAMVRVPVAVHDGAVTSGAVGATGVPVVPLIQRYRQWGYRVLVVIDSTAGGGGTVFAADARKIIATLGYSSAVQYSSSNEPDNHGLDLPAAIEQARTIVAQGRSLFPGFRIWGPVYGSYNRSAFRAFAAALGDSLAGIDYHAYAMGQTSLPTAQAMARTPLLGREVAQTAADLRALGLHAGISVDELNLTWRYDDGTPGGNTRLLSAVNTVWLASACGHIMQAGASCLPYANQNGPLGMLTEAGQIPRDRQPSTPMPGYWGMAAWTGAGLFPHMAGAFLSARVSVPGVEVFAVRNAARGWNVVVIDKNQAPATSSFALGILNGGHGRYVPYTTDPAHPYDAPVAGPSTRYSSSISLVVHAMSVTTLVLTPAS